MEELQASMKFRDWKKSLEKNGIELSSIEEVATIRKPGNGQVLFSMVRMDAWAEDGQKLLPLAMIRGHFVSVLTKITERESGEAFFLLVKQRRVANGDFFYEHPAGMCDSEADPFVVAMTELEEETGLEIDRSQLTLLNEELIYSSPGLLDEGGYFFCCEIELSVKEMAAFQNRATGDPHEGEYITTELVKPEDAKRLIKNGMGIANMYLYENRD